MSVVRRRPWCNTHPTPQNQRHHQLKWTEKGIWGCRTHQAWSCVDNPVPAVLSPMTVHPQCHSRPWLLWPLKLSWQEVTFHMTLQHDMFLPLPDTDLNTDLLYTTNKFTLFLVAHHGGHYKTSIRAWWPRQDLWHRTHHPVFTVPSFLFL